MAPIAPPRPALLLPWAAQTGSAQGGSSQESCLGFLWSAVASVMYPDPFVLHCVWRKKKKKKVQTENRKTKKDIIMLANFCGLLIGLKVCSAIHKC